MLLFRVVVALEMAAVLSVISLLIALLRVASAFFLS
jgi:hypothetical protein